MKKAQTKLNFISYHNYKSLASLAFATTTMKRKSQITVYIILGLLLLLSVGVMLYLSEKKEMPAKPTITVPTEARPVHDFVTSCFTQITKEALTKIGLQGGYIKIPREIERTPTAYLSLDSQNMLKLPYWYYEGEDRTPSLEDIQNQITQYVIENKNFCSQQFEQFEPTKVEELDTAKPKTIITQENVVVQIKWPIAITLADKTTKIDAFAIELPVQLKQIWELADAVMKTENRISFFENRTIDFMSADEEIPTDGMVFECGPKKWRLPEIKKELQTLLQYNIPYIRIENTNYPKFIQKRSAYQDLAKTRAKMLKNLEQGITLDQQTPPSNIPEDAYEYFKMTIDAGAAPSDLKASFNYQPEWGMLLSAQPNDGATLRSNIGKGAKKYLPFLCINQWHFTYDIIYPVKLTIKDETALLNKGYIFQIAFPVIINSNAPERVFFGIQKFRQPTYYEEFCSTPSDKEIDIRAKGFVEEMPLATELPDANITYTCFNQYCDFGTTKADEGYYRLRTTLPQGCNNPIIKAEKEGYLSAQGVLTGDKLELLLTKLKKMNVAIKIHTYNIPEKKYIETTETLLPNQKISLHIFLRNSTFDQYKEYPTDKEIEIVDGNASYDIDALLTSNDALVGGYFAEAVNFTYADIADKNTLILHIVELRPHPTTQKQQGEASQFLYTNEEYKKLLKPELK